MADNFDEANLYTLVVDGKQYFAMIPVYDDPQQQLEDEGELIVLTLETVDGEEYLASIDDDEEYERIGNLFIDRLNKLFDEDYDEEYDEDGEEE